jgi:hypothetical protein
MPWLIQRLNVKSPKVGLHKLLNIFAEIDVKFVVKWETAVRGSKRLLLYADSGREKYFL